MKNRYLIIVVGLIALSNLVINLVQISPDQNKKIGYVKSADLIYQYAGTKEIQNVYNQKMQVWQAQLDTLKGDYNRLLENYNRNLKSLNEDQGKKIQQELKYKHENVLQQQKNMDLMAQEQEEKMMTGVLNQINDFVSVYGKENGYSIILGTTTQGNILFGEDAIDLTDEILQELNNQYRGI